MGHPIVTGTIKKDSYDSMTSRHDLPTQLSARAWTRTRPQDTPPSVHAWTEIRPQDTPMTNHHTQSNIHSWTEAGTQDKNPRFTQPLTEHCYSYTAVLSYSFFRQNISPLKSVFVTAHQKNP